MATDLAPSASAEFTSVVQIPDDAEALNAAAIINMLLPILNRTQYLNAGLTTEPWKGAQIYDDFTLIEESSDLRVLYTGHTNWRYERAGSATHTLQTPGVDANTIGILRDSVATANTGNMRLRQSYDQFRFSQVRQIDIRVAFQDATVTGRSCEIGLLRASSIGTRNGGTDDGVSLLYDDDEGAGWYLRTVSGGVESVVAIPSSTMADGTFGLLSLFHDGASAVTASFNGGGVATAVSNIPDLTATMTPQIKYQVPASGSRNFDLDFVRFQFSAAGRQV